MITCGRSSADDRHEPADGLVERRHVERIGMVVGVGVDHARVAVAEHHDLVEADDLGRALASSPGRSSASSAFSSSGVRPWNGWPGSRSARVLQVALLAAGAAHQHRAHALLLVHRQRRRALRRFVVGMGVHGEQTEPFLHGRERYRRDVAT